MIRNKIKSLEEAQAVRQKWRAQDETVVFTNGCFDLIHPGHVLYLESAKGQGNRLILGLNSDDSVKRLKGPSRPIQNEEARALVLAALASVDLVVIFNEDTPLALIEGLQPDILVKGGDWSVEQIVGAQEVMAHGGKVRSLLFEDGYSTTHIIQKIKDHED